jgi:hypothetical protein
MWSPNPLNPSNHFGCRQWRTRPALASLALVVLVGYVLAPQRVAAQPALACGQTVAGSIAAAGQQDQYTFVGSAGDVVTLTLVQTAAVDPAFTAVVTLGGPGTNYSRTSGVNFHTLPASGVYTLTVHDVYNTGRGSYLFRLGWALPLSKQCGDRTAMVCGQEVEGSIAEQLELDLFTFSGLQGNVFTLTLVELADIDIGFQAHGRLLAPDGSEIRFLATGSTITVDLPVTGTYTLAVHDLGNYRRRGTYSLRLGSPGPCPPPPTPPSFDLSLNQTIFSPGATMTLTGILTAGNVPGAVDAYVVLQLPSGQFLSVQLGGPLVPGIVPIARRITPVDIQATLAQYSFTGGEPGGTYTWYAVLTSPGTLNFVSPLRQLAFVIASSDGR